MSLNVLLCLVIGCFRPGIHENAWPIDAGTLFPFSRIRSTRTALKMHTDDGRKVDTPYNRPYHWGLRFLAAALEVRPPKDSLFMRTFVASAKSADSRWHVIDAKGQVLGRVATLAARLLQGKHKAIYTPFIDTGDHVVIVNAAEVKLTGRKEDQKLYRYHSGYEGGLREERAGVVRKRQPVRLVEEAVRGMLPKTKMGDAMYRKLKVYARADHPHAAQQPRKIEVA
jgi:large subunit ribosomal protein L13